MTMVERVALSLYDGADKWPVLVSEQVKEYWRQKARAAIKAMREPTDEMRAAVENDGVIQGGLDDCNQHDIPDDAWRIMIDVALKPAPVDA